MCMNQINNNINNLAIAIHLTIKLPLVSVDDNLSFK